VRVRELQTACAKCQAAKNIGKLCGTHWVALSRAEAKGRGDDWNREEYVCDRLYQARFEMLNYFMANGAVDRDFLVPTSAVLASIAERNRIWRQ